MATPTDPTFGSDFNATEFRNAITSTMEMGMATGSGQVATFYWDIERTYTYGGNDNVPYDLAATPTATPQDGATLVVPVAVEFVSRTTGSHGLAVGDLQEPRVEVTILDTYYDQVKTADGIEFEGAKYEIDYWAPTVGLFGVNVHTIYCSALDES